MKQQKPILHYRDHEHGGADVVRIAWEGVEGGGGTGGTVTAVLTGPATSVAANTQTPIPFTPANPATVPWIDFTTPTVPRILVAGVYAFNVNVSGVAPDASLKPFRIDVTVNNWYGITNAVHDGLTAGAAYGNVSVIRVCAVNDFFAVRVGNWHTAARSFQIAECQIVKLG